MKLDATGEPQPLMGPPTTRDKADFFSNFSIFSLYTSMVTKNKLFIFPDGLTTSGSRSMSATRLLYICATLCDTTAHQNVKTH